MNVINIKDIKIGDVLGSGNFGVVNKCFFNGHEFCIKFINSSYPKEIVNNIINLSDMDFDKQYYTPLYVVESNSGDIIGYLMNYGKNLEKFKSDNYKQTIYMLKNAKNIIENYHENYKRYHGDLAIDNILFDSNTKEASLIDFDVSLKFGQKLKNKMYFRLFLRNFLDYYRSFDKNIDVYTFNIMSLLCLGNYSRFFMLFDDLEKDRFEFINVNSDVKRLSKELLLTDSRKTYSGEYIIDYL